MMKTTSLSVVFALLLTSAFLFGLNGTVHAKEPLPEVILELPESQEHREYLGIDGAPGDEFQLKDIATDILLIELFSMYCPYCQAEAPLINEFYELASAREQEDGLRIRMIGLGASNTKFEVKFFQEKYGVQFPVFPDEDLSLYKKFKGEGTPGFIGIVYTENESPQIILRQSGGFYAADEFLNRLVLQAGY